MKNAGILFSLTLGLAFLLNILPQTTFANAQETEASMNVAPSIVAELTAYAELETAMERADVVIFSVDEIGNARFSDKQGYTLGEMYARCGDVVPAVRIQAEAEAKAFTNFLTESEAEEFFVLSDSAQMLASVRSEYAVVRGIYDAQGRDLSEENAGYSLAGEACAAGAQVVLLGKNASREVVEQIQARSILVWVQTDATEQAVWDAVTSGCFGVVNEDPAITHRVLSSLDENAYTRAVYIAGHRGYPKKYNENSTEGVEAAFRAGATHAEIDVHLSADGEVVIMHDATLDRTTNGSGSISQMTLEEIRKYKIIDNVMLAGQSEIPILSDMLKILQKEEFSDKLIILEIKENSVPLLAAIEEILANYPSVRDRLLFITFYENLLPELAEMMPDIPRGFLDSLSRADFLERMAPVNAFIDNIMAAELVSVANAEMLRDYGYSVWAWTYDDKGALASGIHAGFLGLTANNVGDISSQIRTISAPETIAASEAKDGYLVTATSFDGTQTQMKAKWVSISKGAGVFMVQYEDSENFLSWTYYTQPVAVQRSGCSGVLAEGMFAVSVAISLAAAQMLRRKR